jgi:hypothetical protein
MDVNEATGSHLLFFMGSPDLTKKSNSLEMEAF